MIISTRKYYLGDRIKQMNGSCGSYEEVWI